jgi:glycosyltransferase involved in cell wall biosynthesis
LHIVQSLRGGGAEAFVRELLPRLRSRGIDARVLCGYGDSGLTKTEEAAWSGLLYYQNRRGARRFAYLREMRRLLAKIGPTIVHTHTHVGGIWGRTAAILTPTPILIHTEHNSVASLPFYEQLATEFLNRRTDAFVTFSPRAAELVQRREHARNVQIIPNGIPIRPMPTLIDRHIGRTKLGVEGDAVSLGLIANLQPHKNIELVLEAMTNLKGCFANEIRLAIFGDGPLRPDLEARAASLGIRGLVRFYGFRGDLLDLLPGLDMVLSTSPREMMPISLLEAMNAGLPIIGTPHLGTLDLVIDGATGIILDSWDAVALANAIQWSIRHPEWRIEAGSAAYTRVRAHFDIEMAADSYLNLYDTLLAQRAGANKVPSALR